MHDKSIKQQALKLKNKPQKILVISMRYLGDVLLTTPLIRTLKNAYPECQVDVLVYEHTAGMLEGNPDVSNVITTPQRPKLKDYLILLKQILRQYDLAVITQTGDRRLLYGVFSSPVRIGFIPDQTEKGRWKRRLLQGWVAFDNVNTHTVLMFLELARLIGIKIVHDLVAPQPKSFSVPKVTAFTEDYVVVHPWPQWTYKQWPQQAWVEICTHLIKKGFKVVFSSGPGLNELDYIKSIQRRLSAETFNLAGKVSLADLGRIIADSRLFIGPDTGITHLAAATGVFTIALFGPTNPVLWGPWPIHYSSEQNPYHVKGTQLVNNVFLIQAKGDCVPCFEEGCDRHRRSRSACLDNLAAKTVIDHIERILETVV